MSLATLAGVPLTAVQEFSWPLTEGTRPQQRTFETDAAGAAAIMKHAGQPVELVLSGGGASITAKGVYVLSSRPGSRPDTAAVLVADRRWIWAHRVIARDFNVRRRTGETRYVGETRIENQSIAADVAYAPATLRNGAPWKADEILKSILDEIEPGNYTVDPFRRKIEVEDLSFATPASDALEVALFYCGGLGITVDLDGKVRVFDKRGGGEAAMLISAGPPYQGAGFYGAVDRRYTRPKRVRVCFERRVELRFDYIEDSPLATVDRSPIPARRIENVMPSPDTTLTVNGNVIAQGTIRTIDQFLSAWAPLVNPYSNGALTQAIIRRYYVGMASMLYTRYGGVAGFEDPRWTRRIAAIFKHWRKTFRIRPEWCDKLRNLSAERVAVLDPETGTRGRALAWLDYISVPSYLPMIESFFRQPTNNPDIGRQISGYPTGTALSTGTASPARVTVEDEQTGLIRVDLQADRDGEAERMIPGNADGLPKAKCIDTRKIANFKATLADVTLDSGFKLSVVLSAVQALPNNLGRYHIVDVTPQDAEQALERKIGPCEGPEWVTFISGNVTTARFAWADQYASQIDQAFYDGTGKYPEALLVNLSQIKHIAVAEAARQYQTMLDRTEGAWAVPLNPSLKVAGAIRLVEHCINPEGTPFTRISIEPEIEPTDVHALLPQSDQRALRKMVDL